MCIILKTIASYLIKHELGIRIDKLPTFVGNGPGTEQVSSTAHPYFS